MSVGERIVESFDREWVRLANGFGGGIAGTEDVCGALIGSVMIIGALYGRKDLMEDESISWRLCAEFRRRFMKAFSSTNCKVIRESKSGDWTHQKCARTVGMAIRLLLETLEEENGGSLMSSAPTKG